jgi:hypothetical protein
VIVELYATSFGSRGAGAAPAVDEVETTPPRRALGLSPHHRNRRERRRVSPLPPKIPRGAGGSRHRRCGWRPAIAVSRAPPAPSTPPRSSELSSGRHRSSSRWQGSGVGGGGGRRGRRAMAAAQERSSRRLAPAPPSEEGGATAGRCGGASRGGGRGSRAAEPGSVDSSAKSTRKMRSRSSAAPEASSAIADHHLRLIAFALCSSRGEERELRGGRGGRQCRSGEPRAGRERVGEARRWRNGGGGTPTGWTGRRRAWQGEQRRGWGCSCVVGVGVEEIKIGVGPGCWDEEER